MQNEGQLSSPIELLKNVSENVIGIGENLLEKLTERQREILKLITNGQNTKQIAETLKLSPKTVEFHRLKLMKNLDVHDIPGLVCLAIRAGLSPLEK